MGLDTRVRHVAGVSVYMSGGVIMVLQRRGDLLLTMGGSVRVRNRKLTLHVARVMSGDNGWIRA